MADIKYYDVILKPVITEKSMAGMGEKKYTFLVHPEANKTQIKEAVEKMFEGAKVAKVNTLNADGKNKRRGMVVGKTAKTKKAIVTLTADSKDIEIFAVRCDERKLETKVCYKSFQVTIEGTTSENLETDVSRSRYTRIRLADELFACASTAKSPRRSALALFIANMCIQAR